MVLAIPCANAQQIPFRVNLLRFEFEGADQGTDVTDAQEAEKDIAVANIYLHQIGVMLVPDPDEHFYNIDNSVVTKKKLLKTGFFKISVNDFNLTVLTGENAFQDAQKAIQINDHDKVVQITYVDRTRGGSLGEAISFPGSTTADANGQISVKVRIVVNEESKDHKMQMFFTNGERLQTGKPFLWGLVLSNLNGLNFFTGKKLKPEVTIQRYGNTIAHEGVHMMNLGHRNSKGDPLDDLLYQPVDRNLMQGSLQFPQTEDLDLIQLFGARGSKMFPQ